MSAENTHRFTRLYQQSFVLTQFAQAVEDRLKSWPVAGGFTNSAVHHQILRAFSNVRVKIVLQHAVSGFDQPVLTAQLGAVRGTYHAGNGGFLWCIHSVSLIHQLKLGNKASMTGGHCSRLAQRRMASTSGAIRRSRSR